MVRRTQKLTNIWGGVGLQTSRSFTIPWHNYSFWYSQVAQDWMCDAGNMWWSSRTHGNRRARRIAASNSKQDILCLSTPVKFTISISLLPTMGVCSHGRVEQLLMPIYLSDKLWNFLIFAEASSSVAQRMSQLEGATAQCQIFRPKPFSRKARCWSCRVVDAVPRLRGRSHVGDGDSKLKLCPREVLRT